MWYMWFTKFGDELSDEFSYKFGNKFGDIFDDKKSQITVIHKI